MTLFQVAAKMHNFSDQTRALFVYSKHSALRLLGVILSAHAQRNGNVFSNELCRDG